MADEQSVQDPAENAPAVEDNSPAVSPTDETTTSAPDTDSGSEEKVETQAEADDTTEQERKPTRAERTIRKKDGQIKSLQEQLERVSQSNQPAYGAQPPLPSYQPGEEVSPERLQQDVVQAADAIATLRTQSIVSQERAINNFERDQSEVTKLPELNADSDDYIPEVEKAVTEEFQQRAFRVVGHDQRGNPITQLDPSVRLADIAKRHVDVARAAAKKSSAEMKNSVARTADESAPKPSASTREEKAFADLSIAEMEARLGIVRQ